MGGFDVVENTPSYRISDLTWVTINVGIVELGGDRGNEGNWDVGIEGLPVVVGNVKKLEDE